jgi:hypothetical protein
MLNETWQVYRALETSRISTDAQHPLIKPLPVSAKYILRVRLTQDGTVSEVELIDGSERNGLWRIVQTSDGSFPMVSVNQPVIQAADIKKDNVSALSSSLQTCAHNLVYKQDWPWADARQKAATLLRPLRRRNEANHLVQLIRRFGLATRIPAKLLSEISKTGLDRIRQGKLESTKEFGELMIGPKPTKSGKTGKMSVMLVFDLEQNTNSIYNMATRSLVIDTFPTNLKKERQVRTQQTSKLPQGNSEVRSAFGQHGSILEEPFPQVKLPVLGGFFPLFSMHSDGQAAKCNTRYGLTEYAAFPVTLQQSRNMQDALTWLVTRDEGTTWRGVASGRFEMDARTHKKREKRDLLIAFISETPKIDAKVASYFGSGSDITKVQFEVDSRAICDALDGVVQVYPKSKLNLFLIRKASDGQAQVTLAESPRVKVVLDAAVHWEAAARNVPPVTLYLPEMPWRKETLPAVTDAHPLTPYPDQVVRLLSRQWVRDGSSPINHIGKPQKAAQEIVGPGLGEVLALMLRTEGKWRATAEQMLDLLIRRVGPLLIGLFGAKHAYVPKPAGHHEPKQARKPEPYPRESRDVALRAVAVFGILLDALGSKKEAYMKKAPFQIGQVLALADTLHKDYCVVVRKGQMPNTLIGTSLMRRALDNPAGALADLGERMMEYLRWAKIAQVSQEWASEDQRKIAVNEARKKLRQYQPIADNLGGADLPTECNDIMKAQLLLGFLASPPVEQTTNGEEEK